MIEINLLPPEMKKKESPFAKIDLSALNVQNLPVKNMAVGLVGAGLVIHILLFLAGTYAKANLSNFTKKYEALLPQKKISDRLNAEVAVINKKSAAIDDLMKQRFSWARKLSALSDSMTPGIWLSELEYDERSLGGSAQSVSAGAPSSGVSMPGSIVLSGYASGAGEQGAALVGKLIKNLKENADFYSDFNDIHLVSIKSDKVEGQDVMNFRIICVFK